MNIEFKLPELGENVESGDIVTVLVREGDVIAGNQGVLEVETDKAVVEIPCPHPGKIAKVLVTKGETIKVGQPILLLETEDSEAAVATPPPSSGTATEPAEVAAAAENAALPPAAGPEARRLARELGVDLTKVQGTGKGGRISVEDVHAAATAAVAPEKATIVPPPSPAGIPAQPGTREPAVPPGVLGADSFGPVRRERMSKIRQTISAQMVKSASTIPHVTNFDDADITELERLCKTVPQAYLGPTVKLTTTSFVLKAVALALRQHPVLNASLDEEKNEIIYKQYINLGIAIDTPRGLVVPVLKNADRLGIVEIARELTLMAARARSGEFKIEDLRGGTFTLSNLGTVGGAYSTPIINHPEVAILLMGRSRWRLGVHEGKIEGRLMLPLSLSYDHRVVDGAPATRFLNEVIDYLQSPGKLMLAHC